MKSNGTGNVYSSKLDNVVQKIECNWDDLSQLVSAIL